MIPKKDEHTQAKLWQRIATLLTAFVLTGSALAQITEAAPGDYVWQKAGTNLSGDRSHWRSIASSSDGSKLAAVVYGGSLYTSSDSGATWTERTAAGSRDWSSIASSSDGSKLAAVVYGGSLYTSSDSGATWKQETPPSRSWVSVAMSTDGSRLAVAAEAGNIYLASKEGPATATVAMPSLPAGSKDVTAAPAIAGASLSATSMSCYTLTPGATTTYGPDSLTVPEQGVNLLGGIGFKLTCTDTGGTASTAVTLGAAYNDASALRVYKRSGTGPLVDITEQVTIQNETVAGATKTVIRYNLVDGGSLDEDGTADGTITDPIYIGVMNSAATTTPGAAGGSLASTGLNVYVLLALAATLLTSATVIWRKIAKVPKRESFR
ncbi:hypothetical protein KC955_00055 [Candidatus Saccharibacteria bacterium]|nr:hypothetical protein [Candidatus Saccharibacteria bacterium]